MDPHCSGVSRGCLKVSRKLKTFNSLKEKGHEPVEYVILSEPQLIKKLERILKEILISALEEILEKGHS